MSNVIHRTTLEFRASVNEPDFPEPTWKWLPDMSQVVGIAFKYWKWDSILERPIEMSAGEKSAVDVAETLATALSIITNFNNIAPPGIFRSVIKPSVQTRTGTITLADDSALKFPVEANKAYIFQFRIFFDTTAAADFKIALNGPASPVGLRFRRLAIAPGATAFSSVGVSTAYGGGLAITGTGTTGGFVEGYGILSNGPNAGDVTFQWAQNTSDPGNTSVLTGSMIWYAKVG